MKFNCSVADSVSGLNLVDALTEGNSKPSTGLLLLASDPVALMPNECVIFMNHCFYSLRLRKVLLSNLTLTVVWMASVFLVQVQACSPSSQVIITLLIRDSILQPPDGYRKEGATGVEGARLETVTGEGKQQNFLTGWVIHLKPQALSFKVKGCQLCPSTLGKLTQQNLKLYFGNVSFGKSIANEQTTFWKNWVVFRVACCLQSSSLCGSVVSRTWFLLWG